MAALWLSAAAVLACLNLLQFFLKKHHDKKIRFISEKLHDISVQQSAERVLLITNDKELRRLLVQINALLDDRQHHFSRFAKMEHSMKRMLTNMSHDLKTPLTVILGYIEAIRCEAAADHEKERLLDKLQQKTDEMIKLMNASFDLARLESGDKEIPITKIHINEVCKHNILSFYDAFQTKGYEAAIDIPETPVFVQGNEEALSRVMQNLLSNAVRYGGDGKVIGLSIEHDEKHVYITVWDKGKGIAEWEQERVFERLYTLEESRNKTFQGSGLGLTITKRLIEKMGGTVTVESDPYVRTAFIVTLKRAVY